MDVESLVFSLAPQLSDRAIRGSGYILIQCPFHGGGRERTPSCSVSKEKPVFFCHACLESGHITRLLRTLGMSKGAASRAIEDSGLNQPRDAVVEQAARQFTGNPFRGEFILDDDLLDKYRAAPKMLMEQGFRKSTLRHHEVGFDVSNFRITFPLRNVYGELVGVSGRAVTSNQEPRYKIYKTELIERRDVHVPYNYSMDAVKGALLWHGHVVRQVMRDGDDEALIITEGFKACMWLFQAGYHTAVALVGAYLSQLHAELIAQTTKYAFLFLDNNPAGRQGTFFAAERLMKKGVRFKIANYPDDREQPDELEPKEVQEALRTAKTFADWKTSNDKLVHEVAWKRYGVPPVRESGREEEDGQR